MVKEATIKHVLLSGRHSWAAKRRCTGALAWPDAVSFSVFALNCHRTSAAGQKRETRPSCCRRLQLLFELAPKMKMFLDPIPTFFTSLGCTFVHRTEPPTTRFYRVLAALDVVLGLFSDGACCTMRYHVMDVCVWGNNGSLSSTADTFLSAGASRACMCVLVCLCVEAPLFLEVSVSQHYT